MGFKEAIGAIVAGVVFLVPAVKWLIKDWAAKAQKIEELREQNANKNLNRLEDDVKNFRAAIDGIQQQLKDLTANLTINRQEIQSLKTQLDGTKKLLDDYVSGINGKVQNMIKTEIVELTKKIMLVRNKKDGV